MVEKFTPSISCGVISRITTTSTTLSKYLGVKEQLLLVLQMLTFGLDMVVLELLVSLHLLGMTTVKHWQPTEGKRQQK